MAYGAACCGDSRRLFKSFVQGQVHSPNWGPIGVQLGSNRGTKIVSFSFVLALKTHQNHPQRGPGGAPGGPGGGPGGPGGAPGAPVLVSLGFPWFS